MYKNIRRILSKVCVWWEEGVVYKMTQTHENIKYSFQHSDPSVKTNTLTELTQSKN